MDFVWPQLSMCINRATSAMSLNINDFFDFSPKRQVTFVMIPDISNCEEIAEGLFN